MQNGGITHTFLTPAPMEVRSAVSFTPLPLNPREKTLPLYEINRSLSGPHTHGFEKENTLSLPGVEAQTKKTY